jgi:hypothetical protein
MKLLSIISLFAILGSQALGGNVSKTVDVFWIPPDVETYTPVTASNIEEAAFKIVRVRDKHQREEVIGLTRKSERVTDSKRIRVKISYDDKFYNFDSDGVGVSSQGERVQIDLKKLKAVLCE